MAHLPEDVMPPAEPPEKRAVDPTLVDAALQMTPEERLLHNDRMVAMALDLRAAVEAAIERDG